MYSWIFQSFQAISVLVYAHTSARVDAGDNAPASVQSHEKQRIPP
jgi:hypothetical protein